MKFLIFLSILVAVHAKAIKQPCQSTSVDGVYYSKELLLNDYDRPYLMDVNKDTNDLYFSYTLNENDTESASVRLNLDTNEYFVIEGINSGNSHAIDQKTGNVYIGAYDYIYKYKPGHELFQAVTDVDNWVSDMFFKDETLYFVTYPEGKMYSYSKGSVTHLPEYDGLAINYFILDGPEVMIYSRDNGIYKKDSKGTVLIKSTVKDETRGLAIDNNGKVYVALVDGIYILENNLSSLRKVLNVPYAFGVAFDKDNNMIYSTETSVVRLLPINIDECDMY